MSSLQNQEENQVPKVHSKEENTHVEKAKCESISLAKDMESLKDELIANTKSYLMKEKKEE